MIINNSNINSINDWGDFWYYRIAVNIIPAYENWSPWQNKPIPVEGE